MQKIGFTKEQRVVHKLIIDSTGMSDIGLFTGKMGIILSLVTYSRSTKQKAIEEVADFLMNQVLESMTNISPLSFSNGLTAARHISILDEIFYSPADTGEAI